MRSPEERSNSLLEFAESFVAENHFGEIPPPPPSYTVSMSRIAIEHVAVVLGRHKKCLMLDVGSAVVNGFDVEQLHIKFLGAAYGSWPVSGEAGTTLSQEEMEYVLTLKDKLPDASKLEIRQVKKITEAMRRKFDDSKKHEEKRLNPKPKKRLVRRIIDALNEKTEW